MEWSGVSFNANDLDGTLKALLLKMPSEQIYISHKAYSILDSRFAEISENTWQFMVQLCNATVRILNHFTDKLPDTVIKSIIKSNHDEEIRYLGFEN